MAFSWVNTVFSNKKPVPPPVLAPTPERENKPPPQESFIKLSSGSMAEPPPPTQPSAPPKEPERRIINPPVLTDESEQSSWSDEITIKARVEKDPLTCTFLVDRPVFEGHSAWFPTSDSDSESPLAQSIFEVKEVCSLLFLDSTISVTRSGSSERKWEEIAKDIGSKVRSHLKSGASVISDEFLTRIPTEEEMREKIQFVIDDEINPGIAAHSGNITLENLTGNTVTISMGGGCQGCAASTITLREGIHKAFRDAVPEIGAILDETDHTAGTNPFFKELPEELKAHAQG